MQLSTITVHMGKSLEVLAHEAIRALWQRRVFSQREFAKAMQRPPAVANRMIHGTQPVTIRALEAAGRLAGVSPVELLIDPAVEMKAVTPIEAMMLRYFRSWPASTRDALLIFASFFADEPPATHDERRAHEQIRRLGDAKRRLVYGYLTFLTEGDLPLDVRKALGLPETDAPQSTHTEKPRRRTT
jgi:hypothetical protein